MTKFIIKSSGIKERFDIKKFKRSLKRAGAKARTITTIANEVVRKSELTTTHDIYKYALSRLEDLHRPVATRYNLKAALYQLGPSGYPFEHFVAQLFAAQGYTVRVGEIVKGKCVMHEIDVCAYKKDKHFMIEAKFHNQMGIKSNVKVPLYVKARFEDVRAAWKKHEGGAEEYHEVWIVTNTQFTKDAITYAQCVGMKAISWNYPKDGSLAQLIDEYALHPITSLTTLSKRQKKELISQGLVLCRDVAKHRKLLQKMKLSSQKIERVIEEAVGVCELSK